MKGDLLWRPWASFDLRMTRDDSEEREAQEARKMKLKGKEGKRSTRSVESGLRLYIRIRV